MAEKTKPDSLERSRVEPPAKADPKPLTDIEAIRSIERTLARLPEADRLRVLRFIEDKYTPVIKMTPMTPELLAKMRAAAMEMNPRISVAR